MSHFNFAIPLQRDDLFETPTRNQYVVENVYNLRDLKIKLQDVTQELKDQGADFVLFEGFDVIFSLLGEFNKGATAEMKTRGIDIVMRGMTSLIDQLSVFFNSELISETDERVRNLNKLKMLLYLFCQIIQKVEDEDSQHDPLTGGKSKKSKSKKMLSVDGADENFMGDWEQDRHTAVGLLYNLLQLNLNKLFDPPVIEDDVTSIIGFTLFKIMENPNIALVKCKDVRLSIIQVLGTLSKRFNYTLSCSLKFVQQLKHFEHLVIVFSQATEVLVREYGLTTMVMELVREISTTDGKELARDTSGTRAYSQFLMELAEKVPEFVRPSVSFLTPHLDGESYAMRKCVLSVLGEIVAQVLTKEELTEADRDDRDTFLECLLDHIHDVHAHVRSHVLHIWRGLCKKECIPLSRQHVLLELTTGRLQDKSSTVRKAAVQLLNSLLQGNPFAAKLQTEDLQEKLAEERQKLAALEPEEAMEPLEQWNMIKDQVEEAITKEPSTNEKVWENAAIGEICHRITAYLERKEVDRAHGLLLDARKHFPDEAILKVTETEDEGIEEEDAEEDASLKTLGVLKNVFLDCKKVVEPSLSQTTTSQDELNKQKMLVQYLQDSVKFSKIILASLPVVAQLLGSKQITDIQEAIEFFVSAFEFGVHNAMLGVKKMLALIWSREASIKGAVVGAYKRLYIDVESNSARSAAVSVSRNLMALVATATVGELASLEKMVSELVASKDIGKGVFTVLWEVFTGKLSDSGPNDDRAAIILLRMCAISEVSIITSNVQVIVDHGLGEKGEQNLELAQQACNALLKIVPAKLKQDDPDPPFKFKADHVVFTRLEKLLVDGLFNKLDPHWMPMAQSAVKVVYQLGDGPDLFMGRIVRTIVDRINQDKPEVGDTTLPIFVLRRLFQLVGEIALNQLNYLDINVFNELKRRNHLREMKQEKEKKEKKKAELEKKKKRQSIMRSTALGTPNVGNQEDDDMGVMGAEADDAESEFIRTVCEKEILSGDTLLNSFTPLLVAVCSNPVKYADPDLRCSAGLALAKFMLMSSDFADKHLRLIFTMLEKEITPVIRANLIIALGDLSFRFPNNVEPWTPKMYARLHDDSLKVRSNTLTVLTHLILNDMIKVKGQISDMAFCIVDADTKIAGMAKHFFSELSKKANTLYNVMPDIVSRLSDPEIGIAEDSFRTIMKYIIGLIEKDKLLESLVEKLCHRFRATRTRRQWRDIAFCLSLFPYSDRSFRKLQENFGCWSDKLHEDSVYESLQTIFAGLKKLGGGATGAGKADLRQAIEELEEKAEVARDKCVEEDTVNRKAKEARLRKEGKGKKTKEQDDDEEIETRRSGRGKSAKKQKKKEEESDEEEDEEEEDEEEEEEEDDEEKEEGDNENEDAEMEEAEEEPPEVKSKGRRDGGEVEKRGRRQEAEAAPAKETGRRSGGRRAAAAEEAEERGSRSSRKTAAAAADDDDSERQRRGRDRLEQAEDNQASPRGEKVRSRSRRSDRRSQPEEEEEEEAQLFKPDKPTRGSNRSRRGQGSPSPPTTEPPAKPASSANKKSKRRR